MALGTCQIYTIRAIMSVAAVAMEVSRRIKRHVLKKAACHNGNADEMPPRIMARRRPSHLRRRLVLITATVRPAAPCVIVVVVQQIKVRFGWSEASKGAVLSAFFWGYVAAMLFGPAIVRRVGRARSFTLAVLPASALTALVPLVAPLGVAPLCALRGLTGAAEVTRGRP